MKASELAKTLSDKFFENGNYGSPGSVRDGKTGGPQAASMGVVEEVFESGDGFSGLSVQSVGYTAGADNEEVVIYVIRGSKKALKELPTQVNDVPVVVHVMGKPKAGPSTAMASGGHGNHYMRGKRIACGSSAAPSTERYAGTFGALARGAGKLFALSNNHVFAACNHTALGMSIMSPATMDARPGVAPKEFCEFDQMVELRSGIPEIIPPMLVDAAIAIVDDDKLVTSWQGDKPNGYDTPSSALKPKAGLRVKKFGRTTGFTKGTVEAVMSTPWVLPYKSRKFTAEVWFQDTWTIVGDDGESFAEPGDSGSLIVTEDGAHAVGLLFAVSNNGERGIFVPIGPVLDAFGKLQLVHGHGL
jgi:hypothetical protein